MADAQQVSDFPASVAEAYANQAAYCRNNDATITARIVEALSGLLDEPDAGAFISRIRDWPGAPLADAVPLRSAGALHGLHLSGAATGSGAGLCREPADDIAMIGACRTGARRVAAALARQPAADQRGGALAGFVAAHAVARRPGPAAALRVPRNRLERREST